MPAPAGGSARPEAPAARSADALLGFAPPGAHAAALMPFSGEERSLQGIYKPAAPAEGRAGGGAAVCSECYTNRTFVYDDGSAHRYGYGAGGAPPEGKGREGKERSGKDRGGHVGTLRAPKDLVPSRSTKFLREIRPPSIQAGGGALRGRAPKRS